MTDSSLTFTTFADRFFGLYQQGNYAQALRLIEDASGHFPENASTILSWRSGMLARLGRMDEAVQALEAAEAQGLWFQAAALRGDPDFEGLQSHPGFNKLVDRLDARRRAAVAQIRPQRVVSVPAGPGPHPLCLMLHGNQSSIQMTEPYWQPMLASGWTLAALQSSQAGWTNDAFVWNDVEKSLAEVRAHLTDLQAGGAEETQPVIACGFSMGAQIAVRMVLDPRFSIHGVIAHEIWVNDKAMAELEQLVSAAPPTQARVVLTAGQANTEYAGMARSLCDLLTTRGIPCQVIYSSNANHGYPPEFAGLLKQAADWIME